MPSSAQYDIVHQFIVTLHQGWLSLFSESLAKWRALDDSTRQLVSRVVDHWLETLAPNALPAQLEHETLCVQLFKIAGRYERNAVQFIHTLNEVPPPLHEVGWRFRSHYSASKGSPSAVWEDPIRGMIGAPNWHLISSAWTNMTPSFHRLLFQVTEATPQEMSTPEAIAWLDRTRRNPPAPVEGVLRSYKCLSRDEAFWLADLLVDQHIAWQSVGIIPGSPFHRVDGYVPYALSRLVCLSGPPDPAMLEKASAAEINFPDPILTQEQVARRKRLSLEQGIALVELKPEEAGQRIATTPAAVRAGHAELLHLNGAPNPLFVLLDADLTRRELAFLGLSGTRLRICDWARHCDTPCLTKVDLNGGVELLGRQEPPAVDPHYRGVFVNLLDDRPLVSPFEGTRESCSLGAQFRIGGVPSWEQEPEIPLSPVDSQPMTFLAQLPHPNGGTAYLFLDFRNLIATVITQWD